MIDAVADQRAGEALPGEAVGDRLGRAGTEQEARRAAPAIGRGDGVEMQRDIREMARDRRALALPIRRRERVAAEIEPGETDHPPVGETQRPAVLDRRDHDQRTPARRAGNSPSRGLRLPLRKACDARENGRESCANGPRSEADRAPFRADRLQSARDHARGLPPVP